MNAQSGVFAKARMALWLYWPGLDRSHIRKTRVEPPVSILLMYPEPTFERDPSDEFWLWMMRRAIEVMARIQAGEDSEGEPQAGSRHFRRPRRAFSDAFRAKLAADPTEWATGLNERQLWTLLWQVGQYGVRVNSISGPNGGEFPPPGFNVSPTNQGLMQRALGKPGVYCQRVSLLFYER